MGVGGPGGAEASHPGPNGEAPPRAGLFCATCRCRPCICGATGCGRPNLTEAELLTATLAEALRRAESWGHIEDCSYSEDVGEGAPCDCGRGEILAVLAPSGATTPGAAFLGRYQAVKAENERLKARTTPCGHCGAQAACYGSYEGHETPGPACDACCGHGREDGWCVPLDVPSLLVSLGLARQAAVNQAARLSGAVSLEAHRKALVSARNEGREQIAAEADCLARSAVSARERATLHTLSSRARILKEPMS